MAPCLDTAAAYRKAQLPHRVDDPASSLGHRRTKPGENLDGADLFPVCEGFEALDSFMMGFCRRAATRASPWGLLVGCHHAAQAD